MKEFLRHLLHRKPNGSILNFSMTERLHDVDKYVERGFDKKKLEQKRALEKVPRDPKLFQ